MSYSLTSKLCLQTPRVLYSIRRQRAPESGHMAYDQAMSAIAWAARRASATASLAVHIHIGWDTIKADPACCKESQFLCGLKLRLEDVLVSKPSLNARSELEKCIQAAEADKFFCEKDGIWLQICHL